MILITVSANIPEILEATPAVDPCTKIQKCLIHQILNLINHLINKDLQTFSENMKKFTKLQI